MNTETAKVVANNSIATETAATTNLNPLSFALRKEIKGILGQVEGKVAPNIINRLAETTASPATSLCKEVWAYIDAKTQQNLANRCRLFFTCLKSLKVKYPNLSPYELRRYIPITRASGLSWKNKEELLLRAIEERLSNPSWNTKGDITWVKRLIIAKRQSIKRASPALILMPAISNNNLNVA